MGTAIHTFVEYDATKGMDAFREPGSIRPLNEGEFFVWRSPLLFHALGLKSEHLIATDGVPPALIAPRGLPNVLSTAVYYRFYHVVQLPSYKDLVYDGLPTRSPILAPASAAEAEQWVKDGFSHYAAETKNAAGRPARPRVSHPYWHTPSWLFRDEILQAIHHCGLHEDRLSLEFQIILNAMVDLEEVLGEQRTRLVFWFDT
jgi:hypothetical protein